MLWEPLCIMIQKPVSRRDICADNGPNLRFGCSTMETRRNQNTDALNRDSYFVQSAEQRRERDRVRHRPVMSQTEMAAVFLPAAIFQAAMDFQWDNRVPDPIQPERQKEVERCGFPPSCKQKPSGAIP